MYLTKAQMANNQNLSFNDVENATTILQRITYALEEGRGKLLTSLSDDDQEIMTELSEQARQFVRLLEIINLEITNS